MDILNQKEFDISHNAKVYTFADGSQEIVVSATPIFREPGWEAQKFVSGTSPRVAGVKADGNNAMRSAYRARSKMRRLVMSNKMDLFCTLTLDKEKVDRYDAAAIQKKLNIWCDNMVRRHNMLYVLVPELHKDGAFHFHGFLSGDIELVDSGHTDNAGRKIYNLPQWTLGFSTAMELYGDYGSAVGYCCKYIGKQSGVRPLGRWYFSGGKLVKPVPELFDVSVEEFSQQFPNHYEVFTPVGRILGTKIVKGEESGENRICEKGENGNGS